MSNFTKNNSNYKSFLKKYDSNYCITDKFFKFFLKNITIFLFTFTLYLYYFKINVFTRFKISISLISISVYDICLSFSLFLIIFLNFLFAFYSNNLKKSLQKKSRNKKDSNFYLWFFLFFLILFTVIFFENNFLWIFIIDTVLLAYSLKYNFDFNHFLKCKNLLICQIIILFCGYFVVNFFIDIYCQKSIIFNAIADTYDENSDFVDVAVAYYDGKPIIKRYSKKQNNRDFFENFCSGYMYDGIKYLDNTSGIRLKSVSKKDTCSIME